MNVAQTPEYRTWTAMKQRCHNPKEPGYAKYGARGITVCERWRNSFQSFLEDMGPRPPGTSIDRIDPFGNYCPENCRWATIEQQAKNRTYHNKLECDGKTYILAEWARIVGKSATVIHERLKNGWSVRDALYKPLRKQKTRREKNAEIGWISVDEYLPKEDGRYNVFIEGLGVDCRYFAAASFETWQTFNGEKVTSWRMLPPPPLRPAQSPKGRKLKPRLDALKSKLQAEGKKE